MTAIGSTTPGVDWTAIRDAAVAAATRGWPVVPGTYTCGVAGRWYGREDATGLCPVDGNWAEQGITEWSEAHVTWTRRPYGVLLVCGCGVDALELPTSLARDVFPALGEAGLVGPIVALYPARWVLLVTSGPGPAPKLGAWPSVTYRGPGHWVPLPPSDLGHTRARWHVRPPTDEPLTLPPSAAVQTVVIDLPLPRITLRWWPPGAREARRHQGWCAGVPGRCAGCAAGRGRGGRTASRQRRRPDAPP